MYIPTYTTHVYICIFSFFAVNEISRTRARKANGRVIGGRVVRVYIANRADHATSRPRVCVLRIDSTAVVSE